MTKRYIIDKADIYDLLTGKALSLSQGNESAFCITISGNMTNGDMIKAVFPNANIDKKLYTYCVCVKLPYHTKYDTGLLFDLNWWNASYKAESEE